MFGYGIGDSKLDERGGVVTNYINLEQIKELRLLGCLLFVVCFFFLGGGEV